MIVVHFKYSPSELRNRTRVHTTVRSRAGIDCFERRTGRSATVIEFRGHPGDDALVAVTSFLETRRHHQGPNRAIMEGEEAQPCF